MKPTKKLFGIATTVVVLALMLFFLRDFNLVWTEVDDNIASVTINFMIPMDQEKLPEAVQIKSSKLYNNTFESSIKWEGEHTCTITIKETGAIKGQNVTLLINDAPTLYKGIRKNASIPLQFKTDMQVIAPTSEVLITTDKSFDIKFNTLMDEHILAKYLQSDASFYIEAVEVEDADGKKYKDETTFRFTPKRKLENNHKYLLSFRKGMPSKAGNLLKETMQVALKTDKLPVINHVAPEDGSKWIGLYPRITAESKTPMKNAYLELDGELIPGTMKNAYRADFYPSYVLAADTTYAAKVQIQAESGELSEKMEVKFTTVPLPKERVWAEVILGKNQEIRVYEGNKEVQRFTCSGGTEKDPTPIGTYYLKEKGESYYDNDAREGANYFMQLSEGIVMHGMSRDENWHFKTSVYNRLGEGQTKGKLIFKEEDALWLYDNLPLDAMIIIHK